MWKLEGGEVTGGRRGGGVALVVYSGTVAQPVRSRSSKTLLALPPQIARFAPHHCSRDFLISILSLSSIGQEKCIEVEKAI